MTVDALLDYLDRVYHFVDDPNGLVTAFAGVAVAFFTLTLWRSTRKLWKSGEKQYAASNRAFVYLDGLNVELTTAADAKEIGNQPQFRWGPELFISRFAAQPRWRNSGNTPTKRMTIQVDWRGPIGPIPPEYQYRQEPFRFFLPAKATECSDVIEMPGVQALVEYGMERIGDMPMIFIWGRADYTDVFDKAHFVEWCYRLRLDRHDGKNSGQASFSGASITGRTNVDWPIF